ncbi:MAG: cupin domain-containing protein [Polyangiales bacterium]
MKTAVWAMLSMLAMSGCGAARPPSVTEPVQGAAMPDATVIELAKLRADPASFAWFQFKPGVKKLILSGTPESRHVSVLWYTADDGKPGAVPLHYHAKTESIFVIDGAQADPKGKYERGSFYFNPPGSGHDVFDSAGLFLLSYAAPPDFKKTDAIGPYEPLLVGADYSKVSLAELPLSSDGGMSARFVKPTTASAVAANVLLVLEGACTIAGQPLAKDTLVVTKSTDPATYAIAPGADCLLFTLSFL